MNAILVHGEDIKKVNDRVAAFVDSAKKRGWEIVRVNKKDITDLREILTQESLFTSGKLFVIEGIKTISKKDIEWINSHENADYTLIVQNEGNAGQGDIKKIPFNKIEKYDVSVNIFKFTDSVKAGNAESSLKLLYELKKSEPMELIVAMLSRQLTELYRAEKGYGIKAPDWKKPVLKKIAMDFGEEKIKLMISDLSMLDSRSKTGQINMSYELDIYIAKHLNYSN